MEFLNLLLILLVAYLVFRKPEKEKLSFKLLVVIALFMAALFLIGTRGSVLPPLNY